MGRAMGDRARVRGAAPPPGGSLERLRQAPRSQPHTEDDDEDARRRVRPALADALSAPAEALPDALERYLQDVAEHPFSPALERDARMGVSRYQGVQIRHRLVERGLVEVHRVPTGQRSGQLMLLALTTTGARQAGAAGTVARAIAERGFMPAFYMDAIARHAHRRWPGATVTPAGTDNRARVTVRTPPAGTAAASRVTFVLIDDPRAAPDRVAEEIGHCDELYLCVGTAQAVPEIERRAGRSLPEEVLGRVVVVPVTAFIGRGEANTGRREGARKRGTHAARPRSARVRQFVQAYEHLHDLDWLDRSPLVEIEAVRDRMNHLAPMPEAQALRGLLLDGARLAARHAGDLPFHAPLRLFLERYVEGKRITEIASEIGVSREWCSRAYRRQALELAALQCFRLTGDG